LLTARSNRFDERNHLAQFGGISFGIGAFGIGIPAFGSNVGSTGGFSAGVGGGGIGPLLTLEQAFGTGFTDQSVADAIRTAEQQGRFSGESFPTTIDIATGPALSIVLNIARGLFEVFDNATGAKVGGGVTPEAALLAVSLGGGPPAGGGAAPEPPTFPETLTAVTTPPFVAPSNPPPDLSANDLRFIGFLIDAIRGQPQPLDPLAPSLPPTFPPIMPEPIGERPILQGGPVRPGGTVNVPVVLGSTGDPTGVRRPSFPNEEQLNTAQKIGQLIRDLLALRKARQNADKQRRAFEQFLAARLAQLGGQQMPFGQAGTFGLAEGGGVNGGRDFFGDLLGAAGGFLQTQFGPGSAPGQLSGGGAGFPAAPRQGPLLGGGGGACPPLFRGAPATMRMSPVPWFPVQAPNGKWFFFGHLGTPTFSRLKARRRHHHHSRKR